VTLRVGVVAAAAAVLTYLATWALMFIACLLNATGHLKEGPDPWNIPPPSSWTLRAVYLAVAILVGLLTFRVCRRWARGAPGRPAGDWGPSPRQAAVSAGLAMAAVLVVSGSMYADGVSNEHTYLKYLPPGMSREAGLAYGHQACDWLAARPWGRPPGPEALPGRRYEQSRTLVYRARHMDGTGSRSTSRLMVYYLDRLDAQHPGPLTQNERQQASVTAIAWFELCPFQQWVHRPVVA
jgi:hypothetical protein